MAEYLIQGETLAELADAIRKKTGSTDTLTPPRDDNDGSRDTERWSKRTIHGRGL